MPRRRHTQPQMSDARLAELIQDNKPEFELDQEWLKEQRIMLMGAIEVAEEGGRFSNLWDSILSWWDDQPYILELAKPAFAMAAAAAIGVVVGINLISSPVESGQSLASNPLVGPAGEMDIVEMIRSGMIKGISVGESDDPENPVELKLTTGQEMLLTGSAEREDILAALEYVLVKDPNPGQRLQSAKILGNTAGLSGKESTLMALVSALLTDENPGVKLSVLKSLRGTQSPMVKDALIKTVLEDENEAVRRAAVENMSYYLSDLSVRSALLLVSRMDPIESVRFQAYQILAQAPDSDNQQDESLDAQ